MGVERHFCAGVRQIVEGGHGGFHLVAHAMHVDEEVRRLLAQDQAAQEADHRRPPRARNRPASCAFKPRLWAWHTATASASAQSACSSPLSLSSTRIMCCTCSLSAPPLPTTASLTSFGVYSVKGKDLLRVPQMAAARAWPSFRALSAFL